MGRRTALLVVGVLTVLAAGAADAQTTSTSTSTSSTTATSTSTTSTTSTTLANPCAGQPCTAEPPVAVLSGSGGELTLGTGGYCWSRPDGGGGLCVTAAPIQDESREPTLVVRAGETLTLRFNTTMAPTSVALNRGGEPSRTLAATNPTTFQVDMAPGIFGGAFFTQWLQGDVTYRVRLDVRAATRPDAQDPRPLSLTG